ncbi:hypothetical protein [Nocardia sp. NPDC057440]|uniref:hypothetical protein n=1 Tax=Nocardia sp. NPDC057440 TaxID=3346134 RepID=UPI00366D3CBE
MNRAIGSKGLARRIKRSFYGLDLSSGLRLDVIGSDRVCDRCITDENYYGQNANPAYLPHQQLYERDGELKWREGYSVDPTRT